MKPSNRIKLFQSLIHGVLQNDETEKRSYFLDALVRVDVIEPLKVVVVQDEGHCIQGARGSCPKKLG